MEATTHLSMHQEHRSWRQDNAFWVDDLKIWDKEIADLEKKLAYMQKAVQNHTQAYHKHRDLILEQGDRLDVHEKEMSLLVEGSSTDLAISPAHLDEGHRHEQLRSAHERLKKYHHQIIVVAKGLVKALDEAL